MKAVQKEAAPQNLNPLLDAVRNQLLLKNDAALARKLEVAPPVISKMRHGRLPLGASAIISIHEVTGWPVRDIKALAKA